MSYVEQLSFTLFINGTVNNTNSLNVSSKPTQAVLIAFQLGQIISILCIIFGILGNSALIFTIYRSSFCRFSYGLLLFFIAIFDIIRLLSAAFYYLLQAHIVPLNLSTFTIYIVFYRYSRNVTNWLKVFLAIERLIAVKYWVSNRYNVNSLNTTNIQRTRQRRILYLVLLLFICTLISQHLNLLLNRYISTSIHPTRLFIMTKPNRNFYYGNYLYNDVYFMIISYIILDDLLPIVALISFNTYLFYRLRHLPLITSQKISESIWILFFLTIFSIFVVPRSFIIFCSLYIDSKYINDTIISMVFHTFQGLEMFNYAITGYACFLSCRNLRKTLVESIRITYEKLRKKSYRKRKRLTLYTVEPSNGSSQRT